MEDSKGSTLSQEDQNKVTERKSEATSDETLSDIEKTQSELDSTTAKLDPGPSPDGLLDEPDEINDAGPM